MSGLSLRDLDVRFRLDGMDKVDKLDGICWSAVSPGARVSETNLE